MRQLVGGSRYLFVGAVFALLALAVVLIVYGTVEVALSLGDLFTDPGFGNGGIKELTLEVIEVVDVFLLGIAVYMLGTGLYTLFVDEEALPEKLRVGSLGEMKGILASTIIVVIGVAYLGVILKPGEGVDKGLIGLGAAAVIAALTFYLRNAAKH